MATGIHLSQLHAHTRWRCAFGGHNDSQLQYNVSLAGEFDGNNGLRQISANSNLSASTNHLFPGDGNAKTIDELVSIREIE
ncbi:hypothetical protein V6N12_043836 [Hibiscus sabdariffa]|uniref:Uncharacterized protein n=1 Tax=Hibiscus sabdariffa TaxID=183260 RepID=A0ABR2DH59_9ROSI